MFSFFLYYFFLFLLFFWKRGMSLEWVWRFSKLSPNSYLSIFLNLLFLDKRNEFGVSLEILQTDCKFGPNSYVFMFFLFYFFLGREEWVWRFSKLSPNSLQTQMISCFIVFSLYCFFIFVWKRQTTLEWVWRFSTFQTRSKVICFHVFLFFFVLFYLLFILLFWEKGNEFGMSLEWVWGFSKLTPNSNDFYFFLCVFPLLLS